MYVNTTIVVPATFLHESSGSQDLVKHWKPTENLNAMKGVVKDNLCGLEVINWLLMIELRRTILTFRHVIDLPPCYSSCPILELVTSTIEDLHSLYPGVVACHLISETKEISLKQAFCNFCSALESIGKLWASIHGLILDSDNDSNDSIKSLTLEPISERLLVKLNQLIALARNAYDLLEENGINHSKNQALLFPVSIHVVESLKPIETKYLLLNMSQDCCNPAKEANEIEKEIEDPYLELPSELRLQEAQDSKSSNDSSKIQSSNSNVMPDAEGSSEVASRIPPPPPLLPPPPPPPPPPSFPIPPSRPSKTLTVLNGIAPPPPPPPLPTSNESVPVPPAPVLPGKEATPPPPPPGVAKALRLKKNTKLKRSTQMGNLYRLLKRKVEGSILKVKSPGGKKVTMEGAATGKKGMADALAEMTKRSTYFLQIEEDVRKHADSIMEIKAAISSFETKDMAELVKFHKHVEKHLEKLTDENQVLARFEDFPTKKLECLRMAAALYRKLNEMLTNLKSWKLETPLGQLLNKVESYFNKVRAEIEATERTKDEEAKRFESNNIHFDFNILTQIKESMVDVSSGCIELTLREWREAKAAEKAESGIKTIGQSKGHGKFLWRAFQLAFKVYTFAGGQDDRADNLTRELAHEIEIDPPSEQC